MAESRRSTEDAIVAPVEYEWLQTYGNESQVPLPSNCLPSYHKTKKQVAVPLVYYLKLGGRTYKLGCHGTCLGPASQGPTPMCHLQSWLLSKLGTAEIFFWGGYQFIHNASDVDQVHTYIPIKKRIRERQRDTFTLYINKACVIMSGTYPDTLVLLPAT